MTKQEMREEFLAHLHGLAHHWATYDVSRADLREMIAKEGGEAHWRCNGLLHSILCMLDGGSDLPAFDIYPSPHPSDQVYLKENGRNWWDPDVSLNDDVHLHSMFHQK